MTSIVVLIATVTAVYFMAYGHSEESLRILIRRSAQAAVCLFALAFSSSGLHALFRSSVTEYLLRKRPFLGLAFGVFHTFHLVTLVWLQQAFHPVFTLAKTSSLTGGGLAYAFMYLMMLTTLPSIRAGLPVRAWSLLHLVGGYWIWLIFFRSYYKNVVERGQYYGLFAIITITLVIRIIHLVMKKGQRISD